MYLLLRKRLFCLTNGNCRTEFGCALTLYGTVQVQLWDTSRKLRHKTRGDVDQQYISADSQSADMPFGASGLVAVPQRSRSHFEGQNRPQCWSAGVG